MNKAAFGEGEEPRITMLDVTPHATRDIYREEFPPVHVINKLGFAAA